MLKILIIPLAIASYFYYTTTPFFGKVDPVAFNVNLPNKLEGLLTPNNRLDFSVKLHENAVSGPEAFAIHAGAIYTGLEDGRIVRFNDKTVKEVTNMGCGKSSGQVEPTCGRPLGMTFNKEGLLYVIDVHKGLFSIDVKTGKKTHLLSSEKVVEGHPLTFLDDLSFDEKEENLYISQATTKWNISYFPASLMEHDTSGRLLKYNLKTKSVSVELKNLAFPNGVLLSHDKTSVLVALSWDYKIFKYYIKGPKSGKTEDLPMKLPGDPDNISYSKRGHYWVAFSAARTKENMLPHERLAQWPVARKVLMFAYKFATAPVVAVMKHLPYPSIKKLGVELETGLIIQHLSTHHGILIEFDENGNILQTLQSPSGTIADLSEVLEHGGHLYLGSWKNNFIGKLKL